MEFQVLGPLQVSRAGAAVSIDSAYKPRLVLAAMLSRADQAVTLDWLVGVVWGDNPPASARRNLQQYVHRLRGSVGSDRIVRRPGGYGIRAGDGLDAIRFRRLAAEGIALVSDGDVRGARDRFRAGLDLWRGPAYAEFSDCLAIADEVTQLEELRLDVYERWAEAELAFGRHDTLVDVLTQLVRAHPYRETLRGYLIRALYGAGRRAEALELFRDVRALLIEQLGIEPGRQLQRLHEQMLHGDPVLEPQRVTAAAATAALDDGPGALPVPRELPADASGFAGRAEALKLLEGMLSSDRNNAVGPVVVSAIAGTAGVGKTALAVHWAHQVADRFPDGQLYLNLRGYAPGRPLRPIDALTVLLTALGTPPRLVPVDVATAAARYRSLVAGRRMLILLDNARSATQVRPLLPASPGCLVLITSRDRLTGLVAHDGARRVTLDVLSQQESIELLSQVLGHDRISAEPAAAAQLARVCAHLPLALRIAAANLTDEPQRTISDYVSGLTTRHPVAALAVDGDVAVRTAFDLSYRALPEPVQVTFRRLGLVPCPDFSIAAAAALADTTTSEASRALDRLAAAHLVVQHSPGRYTMHDLLRQYAADCAATDDSSDQRAAAVGRLYDWLVAMTVAATELLYPHLLRLPPPPNARVAAARLGGVGPALAWLDAERHNLDAAILHAARHGPRSAAWLCADALRGYRDQRRYLTDWLTTSRAALAAARSDGDPRAQATAYQGLAHAHFCLNNYPRSVTYLRRAITLAAEAGWHHAEATALGNLAIGLILQGRTAEAIEHLHRAMEVHERIDWPLGRARLMDTLANAYLEVGRLHEGCEVATRALALYGPDAPAGKALAVATLGELYAVLGRSSEAAHLLESVLGTFRTFGIRRNEALCHLWLARVYCDLGRIDDADGHAQFALASGDEIGEPRLRALTHHACGLVREARGDHVGAIDFHQAALAIAENVDLPHIAGESLLGLATGHRSRGDYQAAIGPATRALALADQAGYAVLHGLAHTILGWVHHDRGDLTRALDHARRALTSHQKTGHQVGKAHTNLLMEMLLCRLGASQAS